MRVVLDREVALAAVASVQAVADKKHTIPIVQSVLVEASGDGITLNATNLDMWAHAEASADVQLPGSAALPADRLHDLLRALPTGGEVLIETDAGVSHARIVCGRSRTRLLALPGADFPKPARAPDDAVKVAIRADGLLRLIERVAFAASSEETRFMLTGVHLSIEDRDGHPVIRAAGCSTRMIAWAETPAFDAALNMPRISLGRRLVTELRRLLDGATADLGLLLTHERFELALAGRGVVAKLLDGEAPDYWKYFVEPTGLSVEVATVELKMALKRCLMMADDKDRAVRLVLEPGVMRLSTRSPQAGEADEEIESTFGNDEPVHLAVNGAQLLDIAGQITGTRTVLRLLASGAALLVDDPADRACGYLTSTLKG
jgi:DNA polymerase-3 subunit beta